jgi:hypothetical protein
MGSNVPINNKFKYVVREESDAHKSYIRNIAASSQGDLAKSILGEVFSHQKAVYICRECLLIGKGKGKCNKDDDNDNCLYEKASYFYHNYYVMPEVRKGVAKDGEKVPVKLFIDRITSFPREDKGNKITFLLGSVGSGKTAFLNYLMTINGKKWFANRKIFIRVDMHSGSRSITYDDMLVKVYKKIKKIFNDKIVDNCIDEAYRDYAKSKFLDYSITISRKETELAEFLKKTRSEYGYEIVLIFDNIDQIYHINEKKRFLENIDLQDDSIYPILRYITNFFHDHSQLGSVGANVVFSLRTETYDILSQTAEYIFNAESITFCDDNAMTIYNNDWFQIVDNRLKMFKDIAVYCKRMSGRVDSVDETLKLLVNDLSLSHAEKNESFINMLMELSSFGFRSVMEFLSNYSWIDKDVYVMHRYMDHHPVGLLAYMLKGHRRYSQYRSRFPNIYLVNSTNPKLKHDFTYWLKRLLIEYIYYNQKKQIHVDVDLVLEVFSGDGSLGYYDKDLVMECLGSLSEVHESCVITPILKVSESKNSINPDTLELNSRGVRLLEYLINKFIYMQLVVEDCYMPYPRCVYDYFMYENNIDYGYLGMPKEEYNNGSYMMIENKIKSVMLFLEVLDSARNYEKTKYFNAWNNIIMNDVVIDISVMKNNMNYDMRKVARFVGLKIHEELYEEKCREVRSLVDHHFYGLL